MCWRCVSDSAPYVMGSAVALRVYGARLGRMTLGDREEADVSEELQPDASTREDPELPSA